MDASGSIHSYDAGAEFSLNTLTKFFFKEAGPGGVMPWNDVIPSGGERYLGAWPVWMWRCLGFLASGWYLQPWTLGKVDEGW